MFVPGAAFSSTVSALGGRMRDTISSAGSTLTIAIDNVRAYGASAFRSPEGPRAICFIVRQDASPSARRRVDDHAGGA